MSGTPCTDCFTGTVHQGTPTGTTTRIHGLQVYVAQPSEGTTSKGIVVMIADAFGWDFVNNRLLADQYAKQGSFLVYLPDFMNGRSLSFEFNNIMEEKVKKPSTSWIATLFYKPFWLIRAMGMMMLPWIICNRMAVCKPRIFNFFTALRTSPPPFPTQNLKIGTAGFCWGGFYAILLTENLPSSRSKPHEARPSPSEGVLKPLIDCAFVAHPSMLTMPRDIENVDLPLSVAIGDEDMMMTRAQVLQLKEILDGKNKKNEDEVGDCHEVIIMPGAKHGFAIRVDPNDEWQSECADKAEMQAVKWFSRWFD